MAWRSPGLAEGRGECVGRPRLQAKLVRLILRQRQNMRARVKDEASGELDLTIKLRRKPKLIQGD